MLHSCFVLSAAAHDVDHVPFSPEGSMDVPLCILEARQVGTKGRSCSLSTVWKLQVTAIYVAHVAPGRVLAFIESSKHGVCGLRDKLQSTVRKLFLLLCTNGGRCQNRRGPGAWCNHFKVRECSAAAPAAPGLASILCLTKCGGQ